MVLRKININLSVLYGVFVEICAENQNKVLPNPWDIKIIETE